MSVKMIGLTALGRRCELLKQVNAKQCPFRSATAIERCFRVEQAGPSPTYTCYDGQCRHQCEYNCTRTTGHGTLASSCTTNLTLADPGEIAFATSTAQYDRCRSVLRYDSVTSVPPFSQIFLLYFCDSCISQQLLCKQLPHSGTDKAFSCTTTVDSPPPPARFQPGKTDMATQSNAPPKTDRSPLSRTTS